MTRKTALLAALLAAPALVLSACSGSTSAPVVQNAPLPTCAPTPHTPTTPPGPVARYRDGSTYDC
ncbi:hypothetical protein [Streptosporangium longisporum]|uniref:Lipoprotein n=1 Tax=Streptosporangium longisporum TaxID=46187 RepID=A0ABP6LEE8_9ACTN